MFQKPGFFFKDFNFDIYIPIQTTKENFVMRNSITGSYSIKALEKELQSMFNTTYTSLIVKMEKDGKPENAKALNLATRTSLKFKIKKSDNNYVIVLNVPFLINIINMGNFAKIFKLESTFLDKKNVLPQTDYVSGNIEEILKPLSVIEWHCNIAESSYSNHDTHPHLHKQEELLHINFIDNNFYEKPVYKEIPKKDTFIPLRKGLREIREIILTSLNEKSEELKILRNVTVYLQLEEG